MKRGYEERALAAWGGEPPDWVRALARACDVATQARASADLGVPQSYVSWALRRDRPQYHGAVETAVRARLMGETVVCPILGILPLDRCRELRRRTGRPLGPVGRALQEACPLCPFNPGVAHQAEAPDAES